MFTVKRLIKWKLSILILFEGPSIEVLAITEGYPVLIVINSITIGIICQNLVLTEIIYQTL